MCNFFTRHREPRNLQAAFSGTSLIGNARGGSLMTSRARFGAFVGVVVAGLHSVGACAEPSQFAAGLFGADSTPAEVVSEYFEAQKSGNFVKAYELLSTADRAFRSKDEYVANEAKGYALFGGFVQATTFKIKGVQVNN
jgi:hypothetical protein